MSKPVRVPFGLLAAAASAVLLFVAGEPFAVGPLAWVALVPLLVAVVRVDKVRWAWLYGLAFGLVYFGVHISWIFLFGWMAWAALVFVLALYISAGTLVAAIVRRAPFAPMLVAGAWTGAELLRDRWPYGAYSWGSVGTTQGSVPGVRWLAGVIGVYGLTFLVLFFTALVAYGVAKTPFAWGSVIVVVVVLMGFVWVDLARNGGGDDATDTPVRVVVVQGGVPRPARPGQRDAIFASHERITRRLLDSSTPTDRTIVVWPEDAVGVGVSDGSFERVRAMAAEYSTPFLVGQSIVDEEGFKNLVRYVDATGEVAGTYQKRHPVPFGEYVPIPFFRRFVGTLQSEIPTDQLPGKRAEIFDVDGTKVATPICFESVFPRDFLDFTRKGAELFVLSTNNASFERSYASQQHLAHTRMRALENRQWVVQAALAGISATIAPDGDVSHTTRLFDAEGFTVMVAARKAPALYAEIGDLFPEIFAVLTALMVLWLPVRRRRRARLESAA